MTLADRLARLFAAHVTNPNAVAQAIADRHHAANPGVPCRIDRTAVYRIARGENANPKVETLRAIVEAAGGTLGELFRD